MHEQNYLGRKPIDELARMNHLEDLDAYVVRGEYLEEERRETNWQRRKAFAFFLASLKQDDTEPMASDCYPTPEAYDR